MLKSYMLRRVHRYEIVYCNSHSQKFYYITCNYQIKLLKDGHILQTNRPDVEK